MSKTMPFEFYILRWYWRCLHSCTNQMHKVPFFCVIFGWSLRCRMVLTGRAVSCCLFGKLNALCWVVPRRELFSWELGPCSREPCCSTAVVAGLWNSGWETSSFFHDAATWRYYSAFTYFLSYDAYSERVLVKMTRAVQSDFSQQFSKEMLHF